MHSCQAALIGPRMLGPTCDSFALKRPRGGARWQGPRLFGGSHTVEACRFRGLPRTLSRDAEDSIEGFAEARRVQPLAESLAILANVAPSAAATPARKGLKIRAKVGLNHNVQDTLHAPSKPRGKVVHVPNACTLGAIDPCQTAIARDARDVRKGSHVGPPAGGWGNCVDDQIHRVMSKIRPGIGPRTSASAYHAALPTDRARPAIVEIADRKVNVRTLRPGERPTLDMRAASASAAFASLVDESEAQSLRAHPGMENAIAAHGRAQAARALNEADAALRSIRAAFPGM